MTALCQHRAYRRRYATTSGLATTDVGLSTGLAHDCVMHTAPVHQKLVIFKGFIDCDVWNICNVCMLSLLFYQTFLLFFSFFFFLRFYWLYAAFVMVVLPFGVIMFKSNIQISSKETDFILLLQCHLDIQAFLQSGSTISDDVTACQNWPCGTLWHRDHEFNLLIPWSQKHGDSQE